MEKEAADVLLSSQLKQLLIGQQNDSPGVLHLESDKSGTGPRNHLVLLCPRLLPIFKVRSTEVCVKECSWVLGWGWPWEQVHITAPDAELQPGRMWFGSCLSASQVTHKPGHQPSGCRRSFWPLIPKTAFMPGEQAEPPGRMRLQHQGDSETPANLSMGSSCWGLFGHNHATTHTCRL